jgi:hypothetical protein
VAFREFVSFYQPKFDSCCLRWVMDSGTVELPSGLAICRSSPHLRTGRSIPRKSLSSGQSLFRRDPARCSSSIRCLAPNRSLYNRDKAVLSIRIYSRRLAGCSCASAGGGRVHDSSSATRASHRQNRTTGRPDSYLCIGAI